MPVVTVCKEMMLAFPQNRIEYFLKNSFKQYIVPPTPLNKFSYIYVVLKGGVF